MSNLINFFLFDFFPFHLVYLIVKYITSVLLGLSHGKYITPTFIPCSKFFIFFTFFKQHAQGHPVSVAISPKGQVVLFRVPLTNFLKFAKQALCDLPV